MPHEAHWYENPNDSVLRQGDIFVDLLVYLPVEPQPEMDGEVADGRRAEVRELRGNWIVMDASCDVEHTQQRRAVCQQVLLAPVIAATAANLGAIGQQLDQRLEVIRQGIYRGKFLLSGCSLFQRALPVSYVEYRQHVLASHPYLIRNIANRHLRIKSPWRESFGVWVGSCISRVGPEDDANIPRFVPNLHDAQRLRAVDG